MIAGICNTVSLETLLQDASQICCGFGFPSLTIIIASTVTEITIQRVLFAIPLLDFTPCLPCFTIILFPCLPPFWDRLFTKRNQKVKNHNRCFSYQISAQLRSRTVSLWIFLQGSYLLTWLKTMCHTLLTIFRSTETGSSSYQPAEIFPSLPAFKDMSILQHRSGSDIHLPTFESSLYLFIQVAAFYPSSATSLSYKFN